MKTFKNAALCAAITAVFAANTHANAQHTAEVDSLERISIVGARHQTAQNQIASASYVLGEDAIKQSGAAFLIDILRGMPGVSVSQSGSVGGLTELRLRGGETNHLLVLIDGVVVNDEGQGGLFDFAHLSSDNIVRIELLSGPQSALWGSGAVGGVLSITTRQSEYNSTALNAHIGNNQTLGVGANSSGALSNNVRYHSSIQHTQSDGENVSRQGSEEDGYTNTTANAGIDWQVSSAGQLTALVRLVQYNNDFDATDFLITGLPEDADNETDGSQLTAKISYQHVSQNSKFTHHANYQFNRNNSENFSDNILTAETDARKQRVQYWMGYSISNDSRVNMGAEWVHDDYRQRGPIGFGDPNQNQDVSAIAIFSDAVIRISDPLTFNFSGRVEDNSDFDDQSSYRLGANLQLNQQWRSFISFGQAVRNPTFTERYGFFPGTFIGNPELMPEDVKTIEAGVEYQPNKQTLINLNVFDSTLDNEINGFVFVADAGGFTAANSNNESERQGAEVSFSWNSTIWQIQAYYSYLDASEEDSLGMAITELRRPRHTGSLSASYTATELPLTINVKADYTGSRFDQFFPPFPQESQRIGLRPYTLFNANIQYQINDSVTVQLSGNNLFDEKYEDIVGYVGEGRQLRFGINYSIQ